MKHLLTLLLLCAPLNALAWPDLNLKDIGKNIASSTGLVTGSQVDSLLEAGGKLSDASKGLTDEQEYYLGRSVSALVLKQYPLYQAEPGLTKYVNLVGNALAAKSNRPEIFGGYHFSVLDTKEINALSAPGGFIFVSKGFLEIIPDEEALAGVLAHEIGHIALGHGVKAISQGKISEAMMILGKEAASSYGPSELVALTDAFGASVDQVCDTLLKSGYSRSQEYEADQYAANLMAKTGYSAKGLPVMLDQLAQVSAQSRGGWMDTHPAPGKRKGELSLPKQTVAPENIAARAARFKSATNRS